MVDSNLNQLYEAIDTSDVPAIRRILSSQPDCVNSLQSTPPPLHWAIYQDAVEVVQTLLEFEINLELQDQDRDATPLDYAIVYGRRTIIPLLIEHGADTRGRLKTAMKGARGGFAEFSELPTREEYQGIVELLRELGLEE